ncbi:hypothetical protein BSF_15850 [Bacillus subtilis]|nr:hypothetical protein AU387_12305 [Bacillus halotolerans]KUP33517.1 hypothetical protein AU385_09030 [Bacillus halotolerans]KUP37272.1 hypothetical protein AU384_07720 [Bacillus halotolerans]BDG79856.1 hypothetical protein BSF_15850 [Bacillus subtilis]
MHNNIRFILGVLSKLRETLVSTLIDLIWIIPAEGSGEKSGECSSLHSAFFIKPFHEYETAFFY